jgi:hypothetical protein
MILDHFRELAMASEAELEKRFRSSICPDIESLPGLEWRGYNTIVQTKITGFRKFIWGFFAKGDRIEGYNIKVSQNRLDAPWLYLPASESTRRFGFFEVSRASPDSVDDLYPHALLLDYGTSRRNLPYHLERMSRDYIVQPDPANPGLLLGKAYLVLGKLHVFAKFFVLERFCPTNWTGPV